MPPVIKLQLPTWPLAGIRDWAFADSGAIRLTNKIILCENRLSILRRIVSFYRLIVESEAC